MLNRIRPSAFWRLFRPPLECFSPMVRRLETIQRFFWQWYTQNDLPLGHDPCSRNHSAYRRVMLSNVPSPQTQSPAPNHRWDRGPFRHLGLFRGCISIPKRRRIRMFGTMPIAIPRGFVKKAYPHDTGSNQTCRDPNILPASFLLRGLDQTARRRQVRFSCDLPLLTAKARLRTEEAPERVL